MKHKCIILLIAAVLTLAAASCAKDKQCRCAVANSSDVRLITLKHGDCNKLFYVRYDRNATTLDVWDTVFCTDFEFDTID